MFKYLLALSFLLLFGSGGAFLFVCSQTGALGQLKTGSLFSGEMPVALNSSATAQSLPSAALTETTQTPSPLDMTDLFRNSVPDAIVREQQTASAPGESAGQRAISSLPSPPPYAHKLPASGSSSTGGTLAGQSAAPAASGAPLNSGGTQDGFPSLARNAEPAGYSVAQMSGLQNNQPARSGVQNQASGKGKAPGKNAACNGCGVLASPDGASVEFSTPQPNDCPPIFSEKNDDIYQAVNPPPKRGKELDIGFLYEYRKVKEAPSYATGIPVRCSTEAMVSQMVTFSNFKTPLPRLAMGKKPTEDQVLNPTRTDGFRFGITPYWERTDFGAAYKLPSSKWDEEGILLSAQYYYDKFSFQVSMPVEYNSFSGQVSRYGFTRIANIYTAKYDILSEERGNAFDLYAGVDGFYSWVLGDTVMVPSEFQYGGGAFTGFRKDLKYVIPAFFVDWQNTLKEPGGYKVDDPDMASRMTVDSNGMTPWPIDSKQNLVSFNLAAGIPLGEKMMLTPGYYYHSAMTSTRSLNTSWGEYRMDFLLALSPTMVINFHAGAEEDPLKTWNMGGGFNLKIAF